MILPVLILFLVGACLPRAAPKSTIEPCSNNDACSALVGYTLYTDLKVSEVANLFAVDPIALLLANAIDISVPDVENHILPSQLFLRVPVRCACSAGIHQVGAVTYKTRTSDTLDSISASVYAGLISTGQIQDANTNSGISDPAVIPSGISLNIPLPCTCFNNSDNNLPAVYMSYVVKPVDTLAAIARDYSTTLPDIMNVNDLGNPAISGGDILAIPLSACASSFPGSSKDYGLVVPTGSYALTAGDCVQCSCGTGDRNLYCMPAPLSVSCSSMQCQNSNLMIGNVTAQQSAAGCNVTSCSYGGFVNGSISTALSTSLQPRCPGQQKLPTLIAPPTTVPELYSPAPSPAESGGIPSLIPRTPTVPSSGVFPPAGGPTGSVRGSSSSPACSLMNHHLSRFLVMVVLGLVGFALSMGL